MIFKSIEEIGNDRICKALTGLTKDEFKELLNAFELSYQAVQKEQYEERLKSRPQRSSRMPTRRTARLFEYLGAQALFCVVLPQELPNL